MSAYDPKRTLVSQKTFDCRRRQGRVLEFSELKRNEKPQCVRVDPDTLGLPSSEWPRNKTGYTTIPATVCFDYALGCSSEADVR